jgi:D-alanyl-lipoteichoic acid acyltransferase DltB (MBOAT superfamily)
MSFAALDYLPFLALVLALFQFVPARARGAFLLLSSAAFYVYWSVGHALILGGSIGLNFALGLWIERVRTREPGASRPWMLLGVVLNLALLGAFKYGRFVTETLNALIGWGGWGGGGEATFGWPDLVLPLGISFYTFQALGYVLDVHYERIEASKSPIQFALYVSFFPQLVAGPIERAEHLMPQLRKLQTLSVENTLNGGRLIVWGLFKKWVLADWLRQATWPIFTEPERHDSLTLAVAAFSVYALLYLDFSAYTDIARGSARLFGIELVQNFRRPLAARSMSEFTQRWHMSLYTWVRDYAFGALVKGPLGHVRLWRNNLLVMGAFGLWHGASWAFVLWGLLGGCAISIEHSWRLSLARKGKRPKRRSLGDPIGLLGRAWVLCWGALMFVMFFSPSLAFTGRFYTRLFTAGTDGWDPTGYVVWTPLALFAGLVTEIVADETDLVARWNALGRPLQIAALVLLAAATAWLRVPEPLPFIYFQF